MMYLRLVPRAKQMDTADASWAIRQHGSTHTDLHDIGEGGLGRGELHDGVSLSKQHCEKRATPS
eukprot:6481830-Amphidinium_carterae.1